MPPPPSRCPQPRMSASVETPKVKTGGQWPVSSSNATAGRLASTSRRSQEEKAMAAYECNVAICAASRTRGSWGTRCPKRSSLSARSYLIDLYDQELHNADAPPLIQQQHGLPIATPAPAPAPPKAMRLVYLQHCFFALPCTSIRQLEPGSLSLSLLAAAGTACGLSPWPPTRITAASSDQRRGPAFSRQSDIAHYTAPFRLCSRSNYMH
ncbi:hypothetical protein COCC4DRAFT_82173 [Bipolaris maydis ATCC 48331]|uniref:Uncharacterized protein n=1 Tax=Cochliobolus heterostrophus (strain C4 / ATCC 48331 / race T) TaxID=665024 RepID=N4WX64_COCH4|nr:uncharacterized protein COCC4DRAFT_82173 [Bipolaris maydis ATCC 48331]ENI04005.1 hypothetical protein COCC4DRAFT_82173 [Bipolaris maydis ATCC 48331]